MHTFGVFLLLTIGVLTETNCKQIINFGFYYPFNSPEVSHPTDFEITDVLDYGIQLFNDSVLGEKYELKYALFDTNCTAKEGNRAYIEMLQKTDYFPFIIGPACTLAAELIAVDATITNILAISYYVFSPQFSNKYIYPNFFRLYPTQLTLINARVNFIKSQGWTRVAIVVESVSLYTSPINYLQTLLTGEGINSELFLIFDKNNIKQIISEVVKRKYSIFIGLFYANFAVPVICEVSRQSDIKAIWLLEGWYPLDFWNETAAVECTSDEIRGSIEYSAFFLPNLLTSNESADTLLGPNYMEFHRKFHSEILEDNLVFDTFSAMVAAIQEYDTLYGDTCDTGNLCLDDFNYQQTNITNRLREILHQIKFQGLTGEIYFTEEGGRRSDVIIDQSINGARVTIGKSSGNDSGISISGIKWPGGRPPNDGSQELNSFISLAQFIVFSCLAAGGTALSIVYIVIMLLRWNHGAISSNTPLLTLTTLSGSIILYVGSISLQIPSLEYLTDNRVGFDITCSLVNWILTIGFSVTFYPLFLKMVYAFYIKEYKLKNVGKRKTKFKLEQFHLLIILAAFLLVDFVYLLMWTAIPQIRFVQTVAETDLIVEGLPVKSIEYSCGTENGRDGKIAFGILVASKGVIMVISMVVAFDTRSLKFKKHRENIWVGISLYAVAVLGVIGIICHQFILQQADLRYGLVVICVLVAVGSAVNLIFLPILVLLIKDPNGAEEYGIEVINRCSLTDNDFKEQFQHTICRLETENQGLKNEIKRRLSEPEPVLVFSPLDAGDVGVFHFKSESCL